MYSKFPVMQLIFMGQTIKYLRLEEGKGTCIKSIYNIQPFIKCCIKEWLYWSAPEHKSPSMACHAMKRFPLTFLNNQHDQELQISFFLRWWRYSLGEKTCRAPKEAGGWGEIVVFYFLVLTVMKRNEKNKIKESQKWLRLWNYTFPGIGGRDPDIPVDGPRRICLCCSCCCCSIWSFSVSNTTGNTRIMNEVVPIHNAEREKL